jgi:hypothetical protein
MIDWQWPIIDELEDNNRWNEAKELMLKKWEENPDDIKVCVRLAFMCWYTLAEWGIQWQDKVDLPGYDECMAILGRLAGYGLEHSLENINFVWTFGYMISLFPEYFCKDYSNHNYDKWKYRGNAKIFQISP